MGYVVIKDGNNVEIIEEEDFSVDRNEEYLHKMLEKSPQIIMKDITENDITTLASHLKLPSGGELDLLLVDSTGNLFLVELKKGRGYREAIAQLLDYASDIQQMEESEIFSSERVRFNSVDEIYRNFYSDEEELTYDDFKRNFTKSLTEPAEIGLILVSYTIGDDTRRLAQWLRNFGIRIYCVEFEYFKSENKEIFVPKLLIVEEVRKIGSRTLTETQEKYLKFFSDILSKFKEIKQGSTERRATGNNWLQIPSGFGSIHFEWMFRGKDPKKVLEVGLHFENKDETVNERLLAYFKSKEDDLKNKIEGLKFGKIGNKWRKIYVEKIVGNLDNALVSDEIKDWAVDMMVKFYEVFKESGELNLAVKSSKSS